MPGPLRTTCHMAMHASLIWYLSIIVFHTDESSFRKNPALHALNPAYVAPVKSHLTMQVAQEFVTSLGLDWNPYVTQIEPHDYIAGPC